MSAIDVGLVGFGLAGRYFHAPVIDAVPGLRVAAIVQRTGDEGKKCYPDAKLVRSLDDLLAIESIRIAVLATPNQTHFPFAKKCLESGRDVVVDKPFTTTVDEAAELVRLAKRLGRVLTVYHNRRFDADFQALRKVIRDGQMGRILRLEMHYDRYRPLPKAGAWREQAGPGSGILADLGPHLIDGALSLFGEPERLFADVRTERDGFETDDAFDIWLEYADNLRVFLSSTMLNVTPRPRVLAFGTKGSFCKKDFDPLEMALRTAAPKAGESWQLEKPENFGELTVVHGEETNRRKIPSFGDWREFYANVRDVVLDRQKPLLVTPEEALDVMVGLQLARESSDKKASVEWRGVVV